jgi:ribosomal protein S18 acetylase RimI-like enzyme
MITKLEHSGEVVATEIYNVFQRSYEVEAQLIGILNFPPLLRQVQDIQHSKTVFYGIRENECLAGVIEIAIEGHTLGIESLTVNPNYFRKGIGHKLIDFVLSIEGVLEASVETAVVNIPAINLYQKHGFVEFKRWTPPHGIQKLAMSVQVLKD